MALDIPDVVEQLTRIFDNFPYKRPHLAAALGDTRTSLFLGGANEPTAGVVCHPAGHVFLAGDPECGSVWSFLEAELARRADPHRPLMLIPSDPGWEQAISERLGRHTVPHERLLMVPRRRVDFPTASGDADVLVRDMTIADPASLSGMIGLRRNWGSVAVFQAQGVGFQAIVNDEVVSVCFGAAIGEGGAPIQISTDRDHQRRGYATLVAQHFIGRCRDLDLVPHWECDESNEASYRLALNLGFETHLSFTRYHFYRS